MNAKCARFFLIGTVVLNATDAILTVVFVRLFGLSGETNPLCAAILSRSTVAFLVFKFSIGAVLYFAARNHLADKRVVYALAFVFSVYVLLVSVFVAMAVSALTSQ